jgi:hypothetical protein
MNGVVRVTSTTLHVPPFFPVNIRIVGTDVYAAVTIRMHGYWYGNEHAEQNK